MGQDVSYYLKIFFDISSHEVLAHFWYTPRITVGASACLTQASCSEFWENSDDIHLFLEDEISQSASCDVTRVFGEKGIEKGGSNSDTKPAAFMLAITSLFAKFCSSPLDNYSNAFLCPVLTALQPHLMRQLVAAGNTLTDLWVWRLSSRILRHFWWGGHWKQFPRSAVGLQGHRAATKTLGRPTPLTVVTVHIASPQSSLHHQKEDYHFLIISEKVCANKG